jgi:hypothetical protein
MLAKLATGALEDSVVPKVWSLVSKVTKMAQEGQYDGAIIEIA